MKTTNNVTAADMALKRAFLADALPLTLLCGERVIRGIPEDFSPGTVRRQIDSSITQTITEGRNAEGLTLRVECTEFHDFPVVEWVATIANNGTEDSPVLTDIRLNCVLQGTEPVLTHGNGDTVLPDGYQFFTDELTRPLTLAPRNGLGAHFALPYMRLSFREYGVNLAVGWPAQWEASFTPVEGGVRLTAGQQVLSAFLRPGETIRTPRLTLMGFTGDESRARNLWRRWYFRHILPREDGAPLPPKLCLHTWNMGGTSEFTAATEENQIDAIDTYLKGGLKPDIWWIDAGWYPCDMIWTNTGNWRANPDHFPKGLGPVGTKCEEEGIRFLLWFEPERVFCGSELAVEHPEWMLTQRDGAGNAVGTDRLLKLADTDCLEWLIEMTDRYIKEYHIHIYRQDFNIAPLPFWTQNDEPGRAGMLENLHTQNYLKFWDTLLERNPGLWIDSCASGGRRNDLETMRRAVSLHYTDIGYGNHPIKQKQHRELFEWMPYFRAHTMNWDQEDGSYVEWTKRPVDEFAYQCALAPAVTSMIEFTDSEELYALGRKMHPIWREAAELMLSGDYYPLTECRFDPTDDYAMQFHDPKTGRGFIQIVRNTLAKGNQCVVYPVTDSNAVYTLTDRLSGERLTKTGAELKSGFTVRQARRTGVIWFYETVDGRQ